MLRTRVGSITIEIDNEADLKTLLSALGLLGVRPTREAEPSRKEYVLPRRYPPTRPRAPTKSELRILEFLYDKEDFTSPYKAAFILEPRFETGFNHALGVRRACSWICPKLQTLREEKGLVERNHRGHYRITDAGRKFVEEVRNARRS